MITEEDFDIAYWEAQAIMKQRHGYDGILLIEEHFKNRTEFFGRYKNSTTCRNHLISFNA